jgi:hypothetical protein
VKICRAGASPAAATRAVALQAKTKKEKLSELMAIGFKSSKAFGGGNWRKN